MRLSASDASFLYAESHSGPMHISAIYIIEGELAYETVFQHIADRIHLIPAYRRKVALVPINMGHPKWVEDPDFDLKYHVRNHQLPPGATLEEGIDAASKLNEPMMDRNHPLWCCYVISGVEDRTLLLQMTHHAMIDGASGVELSTILYDFDPKGEPVPPDEQGWHPKPPPGGFELFTEALQENLENLPRMDAADMSPAALSEQSEKQQALIRRAGELFSGFVTRPAITAPFNASLIGPERRVRFLKRGFAEIREVRRALGGTINDVVLTVVSEGIARYLQAHDEPVGNQHMRIMCPVNVRTEDQQGSLGNQVSAIFPSLPAWSMPLKNRLAVVCAETERIKKDEDAQALTLASESTANVWPLAMAPTHLVGTPLDPTAVLARVPWPIPPKSGWRPPNAGINFVCTNVPGVQMPQYLAGHQILDTIGLLILTGNIGFSVTVSSYNKQLYFNFICEPRLLPDLELVVESVSDAFEELLAEAREHVAELTGNK